MSSFYLDILSWCFLAAYCTLIFLSIYPLFRGTKDITTQHVWLVVSLTFLSFFSLSYERLEEVPVPWGSGGGGNHPAAIKLRNKFTEKQVNKMMQLQQLGLDVELKTVSAVSLSIRNLPNSDKLMRRVLANEAVKIHEKLVLLRALRKEIKDTVDIFDVPELSLALEGKTDGEISPLVYFWEARYYHYFFNDARAAEEELKRGLNKFPESPDLLHMLGSIVAWDDKKAKEGMHLFEEALNVDRGYLDSLNSLSFLYSKILLKEIPYPLSSQDQEVFKKKALDYANAALQIVEEENVQIMDTAAVANCVNNNFDEAIRLEEKVSKRDPDDPDYQENLEGFRRNACSASWKAYFPDSGQKGNVG